MKPWQMAVVATLIALSPSLAEAQSWSGLWNKTEIKKKFDGGKDEQEPAQLAFVAPDGWDSRYLLVDAAARLNLKSLKVGRTTMFLAPTLEYRRADAEPLRKQKAVHQLTPGMTYEAYVDRKSGLMPIVTLKGSLARNFIDHQNEGAVSGLLTLYSDWRYGPGRPVTRGTHRIGRYVPSIGVEHFENVVIKNGSTVVAEAFSGSFVTARLFVQWFPANRAVKPADIRFVVEADGYLRRHVGAPGVVGTSVRSVSLSATWYFLSEQRVGLGLSGEFGQMPSANFVDQHRVVLALRVKWKGPDS